MSGSHTAKGHPVRILMRGVLEGHGYSPETISSAVDETWAEFHGMAITDDTAELMLIRLHLHAEGRADGKADG